MGAMRWETEKGAQPLKGGRGGIRDHQQWRGSGYEGRCPGWEHKALPVRVPATFPRGPGSGLQTPEHIQITGEPAQGLLGAVQRPWGPEYAFLCARRIPVLWCEDCTQRKPCGSGGMGASCWQCEAWGSQQSPQVRGKGFAGVPLGRATLLAQCNGSAVHYLFPPLPGGRRH